MREIISLHIGQCGIRTGIEIWRQYAHELMAAEINNQSPPSQFFSQTNENEGKKVSKAILCDTDPYDLDRLRTSPNSTLFDTNDLVSRPGGQACYTYSASRHSNIGKQVCFETEFRIRKHFERSDNIQDFLIHSSISGGTSSGMIAKLAESITGNHSKSVSVAMLVDCNTDDSSSSFEVYNSLMVKSQIPTSLSGSIGFLNKSLAQVATSVNKQISPTLQTLNHMLAMVNSNLTISMRTGEGHILADLPDIITNLMPYPSINWMQANMFPFFAKTPDGSDPMSHSRVMSNGMIANPLHELDYQNIKFMATALIYRGDFAPKHIGQSEIMNLKFKMRYVDWCPTGFKCGLSYTPLGLLEDNPFQTTSRSSFMLSNSTSILHHNTKLLDQFEKKFNSRTDLHYYLESGMEEDDFTQAKEVITLLNEDYKEMSAEAPEEEGDE